MTTKNAGKAMETIGKGADIEKLPRTLARFVKENENIDLMEEMTGVATEAAFNTDSVDEDADEVMNQGLDEISIDIQAEIANTNALGKQRAAASALAEAEETRHQKKLKYCEDWGIEGLILSSPNLLSCCQHVPNPCRRSCAALFTTSVTWHHADTQNRRLR